MTLAEIKNQAMFQTNNDPEDIEDYLPYVGDYINEGYDKVIRIWAKQHIPTETYPLLTEDTDVPNLPEWMHIYLADWATWRIYQNGNPQKIQRGMYFRNTFQEFLSKVSDEGGLDGLNADGSLKKYNHFINIPV